MMDNVMTRTPALAFKLVEASDFGVGVEDGTVEDVSAAAVPMPPEVWCPLSPRAGRDEEPGPEVAVADCEERVEAPDEAELTGIDDGGLLEDKLKEDVAVGTTEVGANPI